METLVDTLHNGNHSLVVCIGNTICVYDGRGVSDLYRLLHETPAILNNAKVADKVVGKGAAALMILANVIEVYADVISKQALELLQRCNVKATYSALVPYIINRAGTGMCPLEQKCFSCLTAEECETKIDEFIEELKHKRSI